MKRYVLGIDGGGTKTQALIVDEEGHVHGSGIGGRPGMVLIAGTGSSCYGENMRGESWIAGGWVHLISDEGSSYWLGSQAMRCAAASHDGRLHSMLKELVRDHFQLREMKDLMHRIYVVGLSRSEVASLAPVVISAARHRDEAALDLLDQGAYPYHLTQMVAAVADKLHFADQPCELALVGGLLNAGDIVFFPCIMPSRINYLAANL